MTRLGGEEKKGKWSSDLVFELYSSLLKEIWEISSELIGEAILALLFTSAIRRIGAKYPSLASLKVSEEGILMDSVKEGCRKVSPVEVHRAFQSLITHLFDLFSALAEGVVIRELSPRVFPKLKEAERIISQK